MWDVPVGMDPQLTPLPGPSSSSSALSHQCPCQSPRILSAQREGRKSLVAGGQCRETEKPHRPTTWLLNFFNLRKRETHRGSKLSKYGSTIVFHTFIKTINATLHPKADSGKIHHSVVSLSFEYATASLTVIINQSALHIDNRENISLLLKLKPETGKDLFGSDASKCANVYFRNLSSCYIYSQFFSSQNGCIWVYFCVFCLDELQLKLHWCNVSRRWKPSAKISSYYYPFGAFDHMSPQ